MGNIYYILQKEANGLGHAIECDRQFIGHEPFAVFLDDDIVQLETPCLKQFINGFKKYNSSLVGVHKVPDEAVSKYGIVAPKGMKLGKNVIEADSIVDKPSFDEAPSNYAIIGHKSSIF
ncbi:UTP--glucose-1-phosphate uridylyltransferase [Evansella caseinilytica]|uniref:UTP--glucose-1-phosphate uridylyltransferase n=1 Tax=Evansella caseinilytica TaxID=1503961 RepID=A0A1H3S599_9BACI|nr:UTP--glucose-1-phosphate uridylyltransferase [Evansella caseinilytica]